MLISFCYFFDLLDESSIEINNFSLRNLLQNIKKKHIASLIYERIHYSSQKAINEASNNNLLLKKQSQFLKLSNNNVFRY